MLFALAFGLLAFSGFHNAESVWAPRELGSFTLEQAGFVEVFANNEETENPADQFTLFISTFNYRSFLVCLSYFK
jgi:hypothetical protein